MTEATRDARHGIRDRGILCALFCLGVYMLLAQMLVTRELAILCLGNELTIGLVFSVWLVLVGAGAQLRIPTPRLGPLFLWLALALPTVMLALRGGAGCIRSAGEYASASGVLAASFLALIPICLPAGMVFPRACEALARLHGTGVVSRVYAVEALGSFLAGMAFSFLLVERYAPVQIALLASAVSLVGATFLAPSGSWRWLGGGTAMLVAVVGLSSPIVGEVDWRTVGWRWASLGVTHDGRDGRPPVTLKGVVDSRYQNLALTESGGLYTLYGDGQVMFSFPDEVACERTVHFVMAQKPDARRILLLGGNPAGELPWLLKYPVKEVVYVERDPSVALLVGMAAAQTVREIDHDPRLRQVVDDGPRYVKHGAAQYDMVLVHVPEPVTGSLNRYYTREFYRDVSRVLAPGGILHTSLDASERLEKDSSRMAGSVYHTLRSVFPVVKVAAGSPLHFFASQQDGAVSLDRETLSQRSRLASIAFTTFNPLYFLDCDELAPDKIGFTEARLQDSGAPVNTLMSPVSCYYTLILWSRYSHSAWYSWLARPGRGNTGLFVAGGWGFGCVLVCLGLLLRPVYPHAMARMAIRQAVAVTGFCGVALELLLLYTFQGISGFVYNRMGFMVGLFMLGTVAGAWQIRRVEEGSRTTARATVAVGLVMMAIMVTGLLGGLAGELISDGILYGMMMAAGVLVGMQFVAVTRSLVLEEIPKANAAAQVWMADYWGSALGGILAGVFLPVMVGLEVTCLLIAAMLLFSLLLFLGLLPRQGPSLRPILRE